MEEKYGFVYIWYDRKHKRFYIGCHWGYEGDGYICSSSWMKQAYKHRPKDFRRRIIIKVATSIKDLLEEEYKWISLIKEEELGKKYYNLSKKHFGHWSSDETRKLTVGQKISASPNRNANIGKANKEKYKDGLLEETKKKISISTKEAMKRPDIQERIKQGGINCCKKRWANQNEGNKHGYRGVYQDPNGKYRARVGRKYIGVFATAEEAGKAVQNYKRLN